MEAPHSFTQLLAKVTLTTLNQIQIHDMWCAACLLHPGFKSFHFVCKETALQYRKVGEALVRSMISESSQKK